MRERMLEPLESGMPMEGTGGDGGCVADGERRAFRRKVATTLLVLGLKLAYEALSAWLRSRGRGRGARAGGREGCGRR